MATEKEIIRREVLARRKQMDIHECERNSHIICNRLLQSDWYGKVQTILVYSAIQREVILTEFVEQAWRDEKNIFFPKTFGEQMEFYRIRDWSELQTGAFSVAEPVCAQQSASFENFFHEYFSEQGNRYMYAAAALVPGVVFSCEGDRIGYGKGYYDRYLSGLKNTIYPIGIAHELQIQKFKADEHDRKMKRIVTEKREVVLDDEFGRTL